MSAMAHAPARTPLDRLAAGLLLVVLALGCMALFIGIPVAALWGLSKITDSFLAHFLGGLVGIPLAMILFASALFRVNGLYLRMTVDFSDDDEWDDLDGRPTLRRRGPLEPLLVASFAVALVAFVIWFLFFAENPNPAAF